MAPALVTPVCHAGLQTACRTNESLLLFSWRIVLIHTFLHSQFAVMGLARELRGLVAAASNRSTYILLFDTLHPQVTLVFLRAISIWVQDLALTQSVCWARACFLQCVAMVMSSLPMSCGCFLFCKEE